MTPEACQAKCWPEWGCWRIALEEYIDRVQPMAVAGGGRQEALTGDTDIAGTSAFKFKVFVN